MVIKRNIFLRLFGGFLILSLSLITVIFISLFFSSRVNFTRLMGIEYQKYAEALAVDFSGVLSRGDLTELQEQALDLQNRTQWRMTIVDIEGRVLADTVAVQEIMESRFTRPEFFSALRGQSAYAVRYSQTMNEDFLYVAAPILSGGEIIGALRISASTRHLIYLFWTLIRAPLFFSLIFFAFILLLALHLARRTAVSLGNLEKAALRMAENDLTARVYLAENDEFRQLADNFNLMVERLADSLAQLNNQKGELETILASMSHGLMVVDSQWRIKLSNKSLEEIAGVDKLDGQYYWQFFREADFGDFLKNVLQTKQSGFIELNRNGRCYVVVATPLLSEGLVVLMRDVTETRELERIKRDFITNASHELRTPLTAIKGFAETLEDEVPAKQKHYVNVIKNNVDRLISIVQGIMTLSELEAPGALEKEKVNLKTLLDDLQNIFAVRLKEKGLAFSIIEESLVEIQGDVFKLQQVFINLIDNAVKYTEKGGVTVRIAKTDTQAVVSIEDTGTGILEADRNRIFERFYVVDKSRSRQLGGTGLGLSIVKHIVFLHNGSITVESIPGQGSKFVVGLPL